MEKKERRLQRSKLEYKQEGVTMKGEIALV